MRYVIWLSDNKLTDYKKDYECTYGYWTGKNYTVCGELFPVAERKITSRTKVYSSKAMAERGLNACLKRGYAYVIDGEVRLLN